jgi:hypothetical protein
VEGLEPPLTCVKQILSLSRLPFRHTGGEKGSMRGRRADDKEKWGAARSREARKPSAKAGLRMFLLC